MIHSIKFELDGTAYKTSRLNMGQLERLSEFWDLTDDTGHPVDQTGQRLAGKALITRTIDISSIVLQGAEPAIPDVRKLECSLLELQTAVAVVLSGSRLGDGSGNEAAGASPAV